MAITHPTYNDITQWKKIPLSSIVIHTGLTADSVGEVTYENLDESSTFSFRPVLTENDTGGQTIVAWVLEAEAIVLQNNLEDMIATLDSFTYVEPTALKLNLEAEDDDTGGEQMWVYIDKTLDVENINLHWSVDYDSYPGPRLKINVKQVVSIEAIDETTPLFNVFRQYWS
jgi:hypothetical protein